MFTTNKYWRKHRRKKHGLPFTLLPLLFKLNERAQENKSASVRHSPETPEVPGRCWATATKQGRPPGPYTLEPQGSTVLVLPTTGKGLCTSQGSQKWENTVNTAKTQTEKGQSWLSFHIRNNLTLKIKKPNDCNTALCSTYSILTALTSKFFPSAHVKAKKKKKTDALSTICLARVTKAVNQNRYLALYIYINTHTHTHTHRVCVHITTAHIYIT